MKGRSVLLIGCGDIGTRAGLLLLRQDWQVDAVRRCTDRLPAGFGAHGADYTVPGSLDFAGELRPDFVVTTFNPFDRSESGYHRGFVGAMQNLLAGLGSYRPRHIIMSSSTRVFAERDGGWVDENSALTAEDPRARSIIEAERLLLDSPHSATVVRFAGIYGIPGGRLLSRISRGELCPEQPVSYTNRIHREDCSGFIVHLLAMAAAGVRPDPVYIGVDDEPAPRFEVESWLARRLGVPVIPGSDEPMLHNRAGHRRCSNAALRASGYELVHPDYRSGYAALLA
jgi:nucleoside-diphosphate-sugar epimerase